MGRLPAEHEPHQQQTNASSRSALAAVPTTSSPARLSLSPRCHDDTVGTGRAGSRFTSPVMFPTFFESSYNTVTN